MRQELIFGKIGKRLAWIVEFYNLSKSVYSLFLAQKCVPEMIKRGWGRIINIASLQSYRAFPNGLAYGASREESRRLLGEWRSMVSVRGDGKCDSTRFPTDLTEPVFKDSAKAGHVAKMTAIGRNGVMSDLDGISFLAQRNQTILLARS